MARGPDLSVYREKRDFERTAEPRGGGRRSGTGTLHFVVQKHAASRLHYDLRLELDGVMKSWAVPKGPSLDPSVRRLAVEVEDHPIEYNDFEGTIPAGEYGGGTVMLWDRGSYSPVGRRGREGEARAVRRMLEAGKLDFAFHGKRLRGVYSLIRTESRDDSSPQWLLIKRSDDEADPDRDLAEEHLTSVVTGRTMEEIAAGKGGSRVWRSNRGGPGGAEPTDPAAASNDHQEEAASPDAAAGGALLPMLARAGKPLRDTKGFTFEPKYDGIRVLAYAAEDGAALVTRNGNDKARQFPEIVQALKELVRSLGHPVVLDGEIVALRKGHAARFESLQGRMHVTDGGRIRSLSTEQPAAFMAFDLLLAGDESLLRESWTKRRERLEALLEDRTGDTLRLVETSPDRAAMDRRAAREEWEGLIAKRTDSIYRPGQRSDDWIKLKRENEQEFVVGGWTEPRRARQHLGAILLGYYEDGELVYAGHTGTGFDADSLRDMEKRLRRLERKTSPFRERPDTNEKPHWTTPRVVVQIRFNEWTSRGVVRQPVFVGVREDKDPRSVVREAGAAGSDARPAPPAAAPTPHPVALDGAVARQIRKLLGERKGGAVDLGDVRLEISNPAKIFYPKRKLTKGDLLAYYAEMAELILPWMRDRPLVLKRYPNGIDEEAFYQQAAPDSVPEGVRVEDVATSDDDGAKPRLVGGNLATLLYTIQLGAISYDPWHSRVGHLDSADYTILDLDPGEGASFQRVVQVARWVREEMEAVSLHGALKTSGSRGLHIYLPLPTNTPLEAATLVAQIIATRVAHRHAREATVERTVRRRPRGTVYVDYLQNILGKTIAGVYAARARPDATVSTPIDWSELESDLALEDFTIETVPDRVRATGDLWTPAMERPNSLDALLASAAR